MADRNPRSRQGTRARPTHFIGLPLTAPSFWSARPALSPHRHSLQALIQTSIVAHAAIRPVLAAAGAPADSPRCPVRPVDTIHFTLAVLALPTDADVERAKAALDALDLGRLLAAADADDNSNAHPPPLTVTLTGLHSFQPARAARVLYARPQPGTAETGRLDRFCALVRAQLAQTGLVVPEGRAGSPVGQPAPLVLHATLVNHKYGKKRPVPFDASALIDECRHTTWLGPVPLDRLALCKMGAEQVLLSDSGIHAGGEEPTSITVYRELAAREIPRPA